MSRTSNPFSICLDTSNSARPIATPASCPNSDVHPYNTADARLGRAMSEGLSFAVVGQNLLRPNHPEFGGDPGPLVGIKRTVYASLTWTR